MGVRGGSLAINGSTKGPRGLPEAEVVILLVFVRISISHASNVSLTMGILYRRVRVEVDMKVRMPGRESHVAQDEVIIIIPPKNYLHHKLYSTQCNATFRVRINICSWNHDDRSYCAL